ncbi:RNA 2'-phosphotransferase [Luteibacter sp. RCC_6_2]|uniref:RNA 2'-phosphotransferase n=1 Tax=Luteibacter sp. RCC_6_2 TaxID=3239223 RepID=UPI003523F0AF
MEDPKLVRTSKYLSFILRHAPETIGLKLDNDGWAEVEELIQCAAEAGMRLDAGIIGEVVRTSDKKRFTLSHDGLRIRAAQGHSAASVNIRYAEAVPPDVLYHGTATRHIESIRIHGLVSGARHYVHLSSDEATASRVGARHGKPIVLTVHTGSMYRAGFTFFQAENGVWLTSRVPAEYLG